VSAWLCGSADISVLASAFVHFEAQGIFSKGEANHREVAKTLYEENVRSLQCRYGDSDHLTFDEFADRVGGCREVDLDYERLDVLGMLSKLCACYTYQACECGDHFESPAHERIRMIQHGILHSLPHYEKAPWGFQEWREVDKYRTAALRVT